MLPGEKKNCNVCGQPYTEGGAVELAGTCPKCTDAGKRLLAAFSKASQVITDATTVDKGPLLTEVFYPQKESGTSNTDMRCPKCDGNMRHGGIPCPESRPGCCVYHMGYTCLKCGSIFQ